MENTVAIIRSIEGNRAYVEAERLVCPRCQAGTGCGAGLVTGDPGQTLLSVRIPAQLGYAPGERVRIAVSGPSLLRGLLYGYGLPLAGLLAGTGVASYLAAGDSAAIVLALTGLGAGAIGGRRLAGRGSCQRALDPVVVGRVAGPGDDPIR